jgi:hypothetical protein
MADFQRSRLCMEARVQRTVEGEESAIVSQGERKWEWLRSASRCSAKSRSTPSKPRHATSKIIIAIAKGEGKIVRTHLLHSTLPSSEFSPPTPVPASNLGMTNCTLPLLLYKKCLSGLPGTTSVHLGRPCLTARLMCSMLPFFCNCCLMRQPHF